jgi:hypothetical protein
MIRSSGFHSDATGHNVTVALGASARFSNEQSH